MMVPKLSVVMTCYNFEKFIAEAIDSVLNQGYENMEIIVCDDCSKDNSRSIIESYYKQYPNIFKLSFTDQNMGLTGNINKGLKMVEGKYMAFLSGDDLMQPGKIKVQAEHLEKHPNCHVVYTDYLIFNSDKGGEEKLSSALETPRWGKQGVLLKYGTFCGASTVMVRWAAAPAAFNTLSKYTAEWKYWVDCLRKGGEIHYIPGAYSKYRRHNANVTQSKAMRVNFDTMVMTLVLLVRYPWQAHNTLYRLIYGTTQVLKRSLMKKKFYD